MFRFLNRTKKKKERKKMVVCEDSYEREKKSKKSVIGAWYKFYINIYILDNVYSKSDYFNLLRISRV